MRHYNARHRYNDFMPVRSLHAWTLMGLAFLAACAPVNVPAANPVLFVLRVDPPTYMELGGDLQPIRQIPLVLPEGCGLAAAFPASRGPMLAIELTCASGPAVIWLDTSTSAVERPLTDLDSHFLAWAPTGAAAYLRLGNIGQPRIVIQEMDGRQHELPISNLTYDVAASPSGDDLVFAFSQGMGLGSEMWLAHADGTAARQIAADRASYLALARWSPDGRRVAFVKIPDSAVPFTMGELWVMGRDGSGARRLASADAGHGFASAWSPDGTRLAYVGRENAQDAAADTSADALISNLYMISLEDGAPRRITDFVRARVEAPVWGPDGEVLAFTAVLDDKITVYLKHVVSGDLQEIPIESICCAGWIQE